MAVNTILLSDVLKNNRFDAVDATAESLCSNGGTFLLFWQSKRHLNINITEKAETYVSAFSVGMYRLIT